MKQTKQQLHEEWVAGEIADSFAHEQKNRTILYATHSRLKKFSIINGLLKQISDVKDPTMVCDKCLTPGGFHRCDGELRCYLCHSNRAIPLRDAVTDFTYGQLWYYIVNGMVQDMPREAKKPGFVLSYP